MEVRFGTTFVAAIGLDGMIFAADSRISIGNSNQDVHSYVDKAQKIFTVKGALVMLKGAYTFNGKSFGEVVKEYNNTNFTPKNVIKNFEAFHLFINKNYPPDEIRISSQFVMGGYISKIPCLIWFNYTKKIIGIKDFATSSNAFQDFFKPSYKNTASEKLSKICEKGIKDYIDQHKMAGSGGPISILKIDSNNNITILKNDFSKNPDGDGMIKKYDEKPKDLDKD